MDKLSDTITDDSTVRLDNLSQAERVAFTSRFVEAVTRESDLFKSRVENKSVALVNPSLKKKVKKPPARVAMSAREKRRLRLNEIPQDCR